MITAKGTIGGKELLVLGLSDENLKLIVSGKTEDMIAEQLQRLLFWTMKK